jgi:hypothetical protein
MDANFFRAGSAQLAIHQGADAVPYIFAALDHRNTFNLPCNFFRRSGAGS